ncbi:collagenase [Kitasatospora sp. NPDC096147]|uniref:collagenase n=1 Tax=Kitasatospora sp. NPDC096147 TaxID=3364093 RepID=UPI003827E7C1
MRSTPTTKDIVRLLIAALICCLGLSLLTPMTRAVANGTEGPQSVPAPRTGAAPQPAISSIAKDVRAEDAHSTVDVSQRAPFQTVETPAKSEQIRSKLSAGAAAAAAAACTVSDFTSKTGAALVQQVKSAEPGCVNTLFNLKGADAQAAFREAQMVTIADALRANVATYPGDNSTSTLQLVLFLRAGYFVQWYDTAVGDYGPALKSSIEGALDAYFAAPRSADVNDANGNILAETVTLIDSSQRNARYLPVLKRLLTAYQNSWNGSWYMVSATNSVYNVLFRGHQMDDFLPAVQADPALLTVLRDFAVAHDDLLGTDQWYLAANAGRELGRFLRHDALKPTVRPLVKELLGRSQITGRTGSLWIGLAEMTDSYDQANCAYYDTCDLAAKIKAAILPVKYTCSPSIRIIAQEMTDANLAAACTSLTNQDAFFHKVAKDSGPVKDDLNSSIEVVVFNSSNDYKSYAGTIFGIDTDNGGMYLEGKPAEAGNQPRFIAYEAEWLRPDFQIWNLNHEYTHYLDGRFDMYGDFKAGQQIPTVMWVEGFAEYVSYTYRNETYDRAITEAGKNTYKLSTLFDSTYDNSDSTKVYQWGYLAVRYLLQSHRADVDTLLGHYRTGNWAAARTLLATTIGTRYDADFAAWLAKCAKGDCGTPAPENQAPSAGFTALANGLSVNLTDVSTDVDGTIASRAWDFGDGTNTTTANPTKVYAAAGTYTVKLTVTDDKGATASTSKPVTVVAPPKGECTSARLDELGKNCQRSNVSATAGNHSAFFVYLPAKVNSLKITVSGGTGEADLYYNPTGWATTSDWTARSVKNGNAETLTIKKPPAGYVYISLFAAKGFEGVSIKTEF